jgi:hypothetical protein
MLDPGRAAGPQSVLYRRSTSLLQLFCTGPRGIKGFLRKSQESVGFWFQPELFQCQKEARSGKRGALLGILAVLL